MQEIVTSIKGWFTPWFIVLRDTFKGSRKRVAVMLSTISGKYQNPYVYQGLFEQPFRLQCAS